MKIQTLASLVAKAEGKKSQVKIGDVREVLRVLRDLCRDSSENWFCCSDYLRYRKADALKIVRKMTRKRK